MNRFLTFILLPVFCLGIFMGPAGAAAEDFTVAEAYDFGLSAFEEALKAPETEISQDEMGYTHLNADGAEYVYEQGSEYVELKRVTLGPGCVDARGIPVGSSFEEGDAAASATDVMARYPNENPRLEGTFEGALLYLKQGEKMLSYGLCRRDGQRLLEAEYLTDTGDGAAMVRYTFSNDALIEVVYFFNEWAQQETAGSEELLSLEQDRAYFAYYTGAEGEEMEAFAREDLMINYLDVLTLSEQDLTDLMGKALSVTENGGHIQYAWDALTVTFTKDDSGALRCETALVTGGGLEGPRGIRVGDTLVSVLRRFRSNDEVTEGLLYGDGETAPYGMITFGNDTATLTYCASTEEGPVYLYCNFVNFTLVNYLIAR